MAAPGRPSWANKGHRRRRKKSKFGVHDPHYFTPAGPVTIKKADGTTFQQAPLEPRQLRAVVKSREGISTARRQEIFRRDKGCCRYCGSSAGPFHVDHVTPVAMGGSSASRNLVTACESCNCRKGSQVWTPKPIGWKPPKSAS